MPERNKDSWNRDDQQIAGSPPRSATDPQGIANTGKTATDPSTGVPNGAAPGPNQAEDGQGEP